MNFFLFQIFPYIAIACFVMGSILRFDQAPYSWRSKSSQIFRKKQLIIGSVFFHIGIILVLGGHAVGLLTPIAVFDALGISHSFKQMLAIGLGGGAGVLCLVGLLLLLHRRVFDERVRVNTSIADMAILIFLLIQLLLGLYSIPISMQHLDGHEMVKFMEWAQHIVTFRGGAHEFVSDVHWIFKAHISFGLFILLIFPFTRLVHIFSAPFGFITRPYQIVRKRER